MGSMVIMLHRLHYLFQKEESMRLKEIRLQKDLSVPKLEELSGVPRRTIQDLERRDDGRVSTLIKLADALEVTLDELCRNEVAKETRK
jgi:transcriptional regulator with XRE-family HTH domain